MLRRYTVAIGGDIERSAYWGMGYNPYRRFRARPGDYVMVVAAIALAVGVVVWALVG